MGAEVFHALKGILKGRGLATSVGDEGDSAPNSRTTRRRWKAIMAAIAKPATSRGATSSSPSTRGEHLLPRREIPAFLERRELTSGEMIDYYEDWVSRTRSARSRTARRGRLGRLAEVHRPAGLKNPDRRRRHLRHEQGAPHARHREGRGELDPHQAEPDRDPQRNPRRDRRRAPRRLHHGHQPSLG